MAHNFASFGPRSGRPSPSARSPRRWSSSPRRASARRRHGWTRPGRTPTEITKVLSALASAATTLDDPLLTERPNPKRVGVLVVTSDKGLCGAYNANVLRAAEELLSLLREQGKTPGAVRDRRQGRRLLPVPRPHGGGQLDRVHPGARATRTRRRPAGRWSRRSTRAPTTRATSRARTASSASTSCTSCTRSSARCCRRCPSPSGSRRWRSSTPRRARRRSRRATSSRRPTRSSRAPRHCCRRCCRSTSTPGSTRRCSSRRRRSWPRSATP